MNPERHTNFILEGHETARLLFRKVTWDDLEIWENLFVSDDVATFLGLDPALSAKELALKFFDKVFHRYENNLGGMNALVDKESNRLIGQCGLLIQDIEGESRLEVGYSILPEFWQKGYAFEAANACKNYAFENGFVDQLISVINLDNIGSEKVALKNGMTLERTLASYKEGGPVNIFSIQKSDWQTILDHE